MASSRRRKDDSDDDEFDADALLRDPIVLTAQAQIFTTYALPSLDDGGILVGLPPAGDKPWRVEMTPEALADGGATLTLRITRRGMMLFCSDDIVELSVSLATVTNVEAVYDNSSWEPADEYLALDTVPLDRTGNPPMDRVDLLLIMRLPVQQLPVFERLAVLFGKCTTRSARRYRDVKSVSIVARHTFRSEMTKYAARLVEEAEAKSKLADAGGSPMDIAANLAAAMATPRPQSITPAPAPAAGAGDGIADAAAGASADAAAASASGAASPATFELEPEEAAAVVYSINPFRHDLFHRPDRFDPLTDTADMTALDAARMRRRHDRDSDRHLFTTTRALYFAPASTSGHSTAAADALTTLLQRGREAAALGGPPRGDMGGDETTAAAVAAGTGGGLAGGATTAGYGHGQSSIGVPPSLDPAADPFQRSRHPPLDPLAAPSSTTATADDASLHKPFMTAFSYRETTRVQKPQLDAFFADAEAERIETQQRDAERLAAMLRDVRGMGRRMDLGYKEMRAQQLAGLAGPRARTPPWVEPERPRRPPTIKDTMKLKSETMLNPFGALGRRA